MGCDIHTITEIKKDGKWQYVPEVPSEFNNRNYGTFAVIAGVRDGFNSCIFKPKGLPEDMSGKKFNFRSQKEFIEKRYEEDCEKCLVVDNKIICKIYSQNNLYKKTLKEISENEYQQLKGACGSAEYQSRYVGLGYSQVDNKPRYYVNDATLVGGIFENVPIKKIYSSFEEFAQDVYSDEWDDDAQDYGYWGVNFDCEDYHTPSYLTLKELEFADYSDYTLCKYKLSKKFYDAFVSMGGILPEGFKTEKSGMSDLGDAFREAFDPTITICWQETAVTNEKYPIFKGIKELAEIARKYGISNSEDIRIVFAFDN